MTDSRLYAIEKELDELRVLVDEMRSFFEAFQRVESRAVEQQRYMAAREGGILITKRDIQRMTGVSSSTVTTWVSDPTFPARVREASGRKPSLWARDPVQRWLDTHWRKPKVRAALLRKVVEQELAEERGEK